MCIYEKLMLDMLYYVLQLLKPHKLLTSRNDACLP